MSFLNQPHRALRWGPSDRRTPYSPRGSSCDRRIIPPDKFAKLSAGLLTTAFGPAKVVQARRANLLEGLGLP